MNKERADCLLRAAEACEGVLTMTLCRVIIPHVHRSIITRILSRLVEDRVLVAAWRSFGMEKAWMTTCANKGHHPGIRFLRPSVDSASGTACAAVTRSDGKRCDGWANPRAYLPEYVEHALLSAILTYGFGTRATQLDAEIPRGEADVKIPDGIAWGGPLGTLRIEVERLLHRSTRD